MEVYTNWDLWFLEVILGEIVTKSFVAGLGFVPPCVFCRQYGLHHAPMLLWRRGELIWGELWVGEYIGHILGSNSEAPQAGEVTLLHAGPHMMKRRVGVHQPGAAPGWPFGSRGTIRRGEIGKQLASYQWLGARRLWASTYTNKLILWWINRRAGLIV